MTAVQVNSLEIDPGRNIVVVGSTGWRLFTSEYPYPFSNRPRPSFTIATTPPAIPARSNAVGIIPSRYASTSSLVSVCEPPDARRCALTDSAEFDVAVGGALGLRAGEAAASTETRPMMTNPT